MKVAYFRDYGDYGYNLVKLNHTGLCKVVKGGPHPRKYYQHQGRIFKRWIPEDHIEFYDKEETIIHECKCLENGENNE